MLISLLSALLSFLLQLAFQPLQYALRCSKSKQLTSSESAVTICSVDSDSITEGSCPDDNSSVLWKEISLQNLSWSHSRTLTLTNFVAQSTCPRDIIAIGESLKQQQRNQYQGLHFQDTAPGSTYRRWHYKKTGVYRHVLKVLKDLQIPIAFETTVEMDTAVMSCKAIVSLLRELEKDADVKHLILRGSLDYKDTEDVLLALLSLLSSCKDRRWQSVVFDINVTSSSDHPDEQREAKVMQTVCQRALQKAADEHKITVHTR